MDTICAWCLKEQGQAARPGDSHGICPRHAELVRLDYHRKKLQAVLSAKQQAATIAAQPKETTILVVL